MSLDLAAIMTTLGLYAVAVASPGPNFALISRLTLAGSRRSALGATLGLGFAATLYAVLTMTGLALVLTRIGWLATAVQIGGGCYLIYLGVKTWLSSSAPLAGDARPRRGLLHGIRTGFVVNLANPKVITFFASLYAVTIPLNASVSTKAVILVGGFVLELIWYGLVIVILSTRPAQTLFLRFRTWIQRALGTMLAIFGVRLIAERL